VRGSRGLRLVPGSRSGREASSRVGSAIPSSFLTLGTALALTGCSAEPAPRTAPSYGTLDFHGVYAFEARISHGGTESPRSRVVVGTLDAREQGWVTVRQPVPEEDRAPSRPPDPGEFQPDPVGEERCPVEFDGNEARFDCGRLSFTILQEGPDLVALIEGPIRIRETRSVCVVYTTREGRRVCSGYRQEPYYRSIGARGVSYLEAVRP
jgi:hypothetical protein